MRTSEDEQKKTGIAIGRAPTRPMTSGVPAVVGELLAPYRRLVSALEFCDAVPLPPAIEAVVDAFPRLIEMLDGELMAYITAYADKCAALEDKLLSAELQLARLKKR